MKSFFNYPIAIYLAAAIACLCIMTIVDYILGAEAEHLNAWVILNRLAGRPTEIGDSLAIVHFGLYGATLFMCFINILFGVVLTGFIGFVIKLFHS